MAKKNVLMRIQTSKAGKMYAEATADVSFKKGDRFPVLDPTQFLSDEQKAELAQEGRVTLKTPSGKEYTLYASLVGEVVRFEE